MVVMITPVAFDTIGYQVSSDMLFFDRAKEPKF